MVDWLRALITALGLALLAPAGHAETLWAETGADGRPVLHLYFYWSVTCPHCATAHPDIEAIARQRPWLRLHALELTRHPENVHRYQEMAGELGETAASVPAVLFCGEMRVGWGRNARAFIAQRLDDCHTRLSGGAAPVSEKWAKPWAKPRAEPGIELPIVGAIDPGALSLPALTLVLAGLDAFNPCAFFVLLFLLSMLAHQKSRARMAGIGAVFVLVSGLMYFAFMAAWLNVFQLFGHLAWVTLAAGALALGIGAVNIKDFFLFGRGLSLSIPEARKPDIFRRARTERNP